MNPARVWLPTIAAVTGSVMVGFMPLLARRLYAVGVDPASMLLWRYVIALPALLIAAAAIRLNLFVAWRRGAWKTTCASRPCLFGSGCGKSPRTACS